MNSACILQIVAGVIIIIGAIIGLVFYFAAADSAKETCEYDIDPDGCEVGTYKTHNNNNTHTHTHTHAIDPSEVFEVDTHKDPQQQRTPTQCDPSGDCEIIINHQYMKGHNNNVGAAHSYRMQPCQLSTHSTTPSHLVFMVGTTGPCPWIAPHHHLPCGRRRHHPVTK